MAACIRSDPVGCRRSVMTAWPPAASIASAISLSPQATTTGPISAATARRQTCTIIGVPAISASGLPGNRVAASREGIRMIGFSGTALVTGLLCCRSRSDNMPGSFAHRKRDNLCALRGQLAHVVVRMEQDNRLDPDGDDHRDGVRDFGRPAGPPEA